MPTTCAVVGCHNRQSKHCLLSFYRFPKEKERRRRWIAFVSHKNSDGSAWELDNGDRICSEHFIMGKKSDLFASPDFVPSIQVKNSRATECNAALSRFERASHRAKLQTERRRQEERNALKDEELILCIVRAFNNDHTYARQLLTEDTPREEPLALHCRHVDLPAVDDAVVVLQPTLSQSEQSAKDCCIPAEIGMVVTLTLVLLNNQLKDLCSKQNS